MSTRMRTPQAEVQACHDKASRMRFPELAGELRELLGGKLVAYIGSVGETRAVREWAEGRRAPGSREVRLKLRLAYEVASCIASADGAEIAQAWFQGLNPLLDDVSPARLLRDGSYEEVGPLILAAERQFLAAG
jgi:hypothetical protein